MAMVADNLCFVALIWAPEHNFLAAKVVKNHFQYGCRWREIVTLKDYIF